jgi:hypothetical protein
MIKLNFTILKSVDGTHTTTTTQDDEVIVQIDGNKYQIVYGGNSSYLLGKDVHKMFKIEELSAVVLRTNSGDMKHYFISFHDIPAIHPSCGLRCQSLSQKFNFSLYRFTNEKFIDVRFALRSDENPRNFALGGFNVILFIQEFRRASSHELRIPVLWKMLIMALHKSGYFNIYDYFNFQTTGFVLFQRMLSFPQHCPQNTILELFYSFVKKILANNAWFFIVKQSIKLIIGRPSQELIELFSDPKNPPIVNFFDRKLGVVGLTKHDGVGMSYCMCRYALVLLSTTEVQVVHDDSYARESLFDVSQELNVILSKLFPPSDNYDGPLRRRPACVDTSAIKQGFSNFGCLNFIVFKDENLIYVFIQRSDGTIEPFNIYMFILSKMLSGDELEQLTLTFTHFSWLSTKDLIEGLLKCGFQPIFDGNATSEQIRTFLSDSDFGYVLQELCVQYSVGANYEAHLDSIKENCFIKDFKRIFEFILEQQLQEIHDLGPEIVKIRDFLIQLVKFLTVSGDY